MDRKKDLFEPPLFPAPISAGVATKIAGTITSLVWDAIEIFVFVPSSPGGCTG